MLQKYITVNHTFRGVHQWKTCNIDVVDFLKNLHHHEFQLKVKLSVTDSDRELEFITVQLILDGLIRSLFPNYNTPNNSKLIEDKLQLIDFRYDTNLPYTANLCGYSCEQICELIIENFLRMFPQIHQITVEISEDGHYSGIVQQTNEVSI